MDSAYSQTRNTPLDQPVNPTGDRRSGRRVLLILLAIFAAPVIASWVLYATRDHWSFTSGNYGNLVRPVRPLSGLALQDVTGRPLGADSLRGKWTMVYLDPAECAAACRDALYKMRQVRLALGEDMHRVQRMLVLADSRPTAELESLIRGEYAGTMLVMTPDSPASRKEVLSRFGDPPGAAVYLVDPRGNLMMRYAPQVPAKGMLKDLQRLLKASWIG